MSLFLNCGYAGTQGVYIFCCSNCIDGNVVQWIKFWFRLKQTYMEVWKRQKCQGGWIQGL